MELTPWNRRDTRDFVITTKRILDMIIAGSFAGLFIDPSNISIGVFFGLLFVMFCSCVVGYIYRRM